MKNIVLAGLMGAGKTSVAIELNKIFPDFELIEVDKLIEQREQCSINEIFAQKGEQYFRQVEKQLIDEILSDENQIISLGGGSLENNFNWELSKKSAITFYLEASVKILYNRVKSSKDRPLLNCENPEQKLAELLAKRETNYKKADFIVNVDSLTIEQVAKEIEKVYRYANG